jgi:hypothetical protein
VCVCVCVRERVCKCVSVCVRRTRGEGGSLAAHPKVGELHVKILAVQGEGEQVKGLLLGTSLTALHTRTRISSQVACGSKEALGDRVGPARYLASATSKLDLLSQETKVRLVRH